MFSKIIFLLGLITPSLSIWQCSNDTDCSVLSGSVCDAGQCVCAGGTQSVLGGTVCAEISPYHYSSCLEDFQCSGLFTSYECRESGANKICACQPSHHYFHGRCWQTIDFGDSCSRDEECMSPLRDPYSLRCNGTCVCADGYYLRQKGECRKIAYAVGDGCVLNADCQFEGGLCDQTELRCYDSYNPDTLKSSTSTPPHTISKMVPLVKQHGLTCNTESPCEDPFICQGVCVCPSGYYADSSGSMCLAELGSPVTSSDQCTGLFTEVRDGICTCLANFYFDDNMRDCIKVARTLTDACTSDSNCLTFGLASRCSAPLQYQLRSCQCHPQLATWHEDTHMCKLFAGIGDSCNSNSDCLVGELEIQCDIQSDGQGVCVCPEGYVESDGLCLTTGLDLGDVCQSTLECTSTPNTVCELGRCSCDSSGYQEIDGACAPIIGGICTENSDCVINNTICVDNEDLKSCQCSEDFVQYEDQCWLKTPNLNSSCDVSAQCFNLMGLNSVCANNGCVCEDGYHFRDGLCWHITGLFEVCARTSECYLQDMSERVVCRNSLCQCDFDYPYSDELNTCVSSASNLFISLFVLLASVFVSSRQI